MTAETSESDIKTELAHLKEGIGQVMAVLDKSGISTIQGSYSTQELSERWSLSPATVRRIIHDHKLKRQRGVRVVRIPFDEVLRYERQMEEARLSKREKLDRAKERMGYR